MNNKFLILSFLIIGLIFRLLLTSNGNFIFHMDSARDMVDVREMVELQKPRLTGPTSAIEGFYNGPAWYYLLALPYILTGGNPYGSILMEITLWLIGGYFLFKLVGRWGTLATLIAGGLWVASNYITLLTLYSFNPNPVPLLTPFLIYLLEKYLTTKKLLYSLSFWFLGGLFFNFEMNAGIFVPVFFLTTLILTNNLQVLRLRTFWIGTLGFILCLLPQVIFDYKHQFIMSQSIIRYLSEGSIQGSYNPIARLGLMLTTFYQGFTPTFFNNPLLTNALIISFFYLVSKSIKKTLTSNLLLAISFSIIISSLIGYTILPVTVNPWHLGMIIVSAIVLSSWIVGTIFKPLAVILTLLVLSFGFSNIYHFFTVDYGKASNDPSNYANEIAAIDKVYELAEGQGFKLYTHIPSVYDYPYQYLVWWHGQKKYGYLPAEYTYQPDKPPYIPSQDRFQNINSSIPQSNLVFLIINPQDQRLKELWYNHFVKFPLVSTFKVGPLIVEKRTDS